MLKLAINAGHGYNTAGKRCLKSIDPDETKEYVLNKRVCDKLEKMLSVYDGIQILRIDDGSELTITQRTNKANAFNADFYLGVHHNAGINGGSGGGTEAYVYLKVDDVTLAWQKELYESLVRNTGLSGNRAQPLRKADLGECRQTKMPAVLLELGFMDSTVDTPIILTDAFAEKCAKAICEVVVKKGGLAKKTTAKKTVDEIAQEVIDGKWGNGDERKSRLKTAGYDYKSVQSRVNELIKSAPTKKSNTEIAKEVIRGEWGNGEERKKKLTSAGYNFSDVQKKVNELLS